MPKTLTDIRSLARTHCPAMVRVLVGIARESRSPAAARVAAAEAVLNRGWGKPMQPVSADGDLSVQITIRNIVEEVKVIDAEPREVKEIESK